MKADLTRSRFTPSDHNRRLLFQQARVTLDAELNEQIDIDLHRDQVTTLDVVGQSGAPVDDAGFGLTPTTTLLAIGSGATTIVAVGQAATIVERTGVWSTIAAPAGVKATLRAVSVNATGHWVAVGDAGTVLHSAGGAITQATLPAGTNGDLLGVWLGDTGKAVAVGAGGVILTSPDAVTWTKHAAIAGVTGALRAVDFFDAQHGWAVGDAATILQTTDGGTTWTIAAAPAGVESTLRAVCALGTASAAAVGDASTALALSAGAWARMVLPDGVDARLTGAATVPAAGDDLMVCGERGTLLRAPVTGGTPGAWTALSGAGSSDLRAISAVPVGASAVGAFAAWCDVAPSSAVTTVTPTVPGVDVQIGPGRFYVDGILVENDAPVLLGQQPDRPDWTPPAAGTYAAYLDTWERHLTAVERAELREVALGGPDTSTRARTIWQVRLDAAAGGATCALYPAGWAPSGGSTGRLRAQADPAPVTSDDCMVPQDGGYRRLENQLYRVEIHTGGAPGAATFVWSRDNGSMLSRIVDTDPTLKTVTVAQPGRDDVIGFATANLIELSDEQHALSGQPGTLLDVAHVDDDVITMPNAATVPAFGALGTIPTARRWDGTATVQAGTWIDLEDGVQVQFADGNYHTGDWWMIPARTLTATVDWPTEDDEALFEPAAGITHHYAPLGIVTVDAAGIWAVSGDCRPLFPPLTRATRFFGVGGDGQQLAEGAPGLLPAPLEVGVMRGTEPIVGASVSFTVTSGGGTVDHATAQTDAQGVASVQWTIGPAGPQRVEARLLDPAGAPTHATPIHFNAMRFALGAGTCTVSARPGNDLQLAADQLIAAGGGELCLAAGRYELPEPVMFRGSKDAQSVSVTVSGRGASTVLVTREWPCVMAFLDLTNVFVRGIAAESVGDMEHAKQLVTELRKGSKDNPIDILGTLSFIQCPEVVVVDCDLACGDGEAAVCACISNSPPSTAPAAGGDDPQFMIKGAAQKALGTSAGTWVERCRLAVGDQQHGVVVTGAARAIVARNYVTLLAGATGLSPNRKSGKTPSETAKRIVAEMLEAQVGEQTIDTEQIEMRKAAAVVNVLRDDPTIEIWKAYAASTTGERATAVGDGAAEFVEKALQDVVEGKASKGLETAVTAALVSARAGQIAITIRAITGAETTQIVENVVEGCATAIDLNRPVRALVADNIFSVLLRAGTKNLATGISARDVPHLQICANNGRLVGRDAGPASNGVLIEGTLGPYLLVRETSLDRFRHGVVVLPDGDLEPTGHMWLVAETMAANTGHAGPLTPNQIPILQAPPEVERERNYGT